MLSNGVIFDRPSLNCRRFHVIGLNGKVIILRGCDGGGDGDYDYDEVVVVVVVIMMMW